MNPRNDVPEGDCGADNGNVKDRQTRSARRSGEERSVCARPHAKRAIFEHVENREHRFANVPTAVRNETVETVERFVQLEATIMVDTSDFFRAIFE